MHVADALHGLMKCHASGSFCEVVSVAVMQECLEIESVLVAYSVATVPGFGSVGV